MKEAIFNSQLLLLASFAVSSIFFLASSVSGQNSSATCTKSMIQSFNPCTSFLTRGKGSPNLDCCVSLKDLMSNGQNCLCLIVTGGVSFKVPINRTLVMSLPRACKMQGAPVECKDQGSPVKNSPKASPPSPPAPPPSFGDIIPKMTPPGMRPTLTLSNARPLKNDYTPFLVMYCLIFFMY